MALASSWQVWERWKRRENENVPGTSPEKTGDGGGGRRGRRRRKEEGVRGSKEGRKEGEKSPVPGVWTFMKRGYQTESVLYAPA